MYEGNTFGADGCYRRSISSTDLRTPLGQDTTSSDGGTLAERVVHSAKPIDDWRNHSGQLKRVQRNCKECSLLRTDRKRGGTTTYFCDNGTEIPDNLQGEIHLRQSPAKRRRTSAEEEKAAE
ncbi:hypothetical protein GQ600_8129 [Phytophthora cactorum]|nr:hypothetical protein GQ600_8129 [Phytophthora cactorum]